MKLSQMIKGFIAQQIELHPQIEPWLGDWCSDFETQVNIDPFGLEEDTFVSSTGREYQGWFDPEDHYIHTNIRVCPPKGETVWDDRWVNRPIFQKWGLLGVSGWDWRQQESRFVGYDFDSIIGHKGKNVLDPDQLRIVRERAMQLPFVTARTSKGGHGIHLLVPLNPRVSTKSRKEHKALAKHILAKMSKACNYNFQDVADKCGENLWCWERGLKDNGLQKLDP